jgi:putative glutamine amidotransferase
VKPRPVILIVPSVQQRGVEFADFSVSLSDNYSRAIVGAGGLPLILTCSTEPEIVAESIARADGVLLTGGDDVDPELFTKEVLPKRVRSAIALDDPRRDLLELLVIEEVFRQTKPLLAICRGAQMLNGALGGDLIWDIPQQVRGALAHKQMDRKNEPVHDVSLTRGSLLSTVAGTDTLAVNSTHHQAAGRVASLLRATAKSSDGIVEALELKVEESNRLPWLLGVQFHPERLLRSHAAFPNLFRAFVSACGR